MEENNNKLHFILVHGLGMGAWCWFKLKSLLESQQHKVTVPDLLASGVNETKIDDVCSFSDYSEPLFKLIRELPPYEKAILVGNCIGGISIAMAAELYPNKVKATVFLGAIMPDAKNAPSYVLEKFLDWVPEGFWIDTDFQDTPTKQIVLLGPQFLKSNIFNLSPDQDASLAGMLVRPSSLFLEDLSGHKKFTEEGYGSVYRALIITNKGAKAVTKEFNEWQMQNAGVSSCYTIEKSDDMAMVSTPEEVFQILLDIEAS